MGNCSSKGLPGGANSSNIDEPGGPNASLQYHHAESHDIRERDVVTDEGKGKHGDGDRENDRAE